MAVRVRFRLKGSAGEIESSALLNGGFEVDGPHVLLPARVAAQLVGLEVNQATHQPAHVAGGEIDLVLLPRRLQGCVVTADRTGRSIEFEAYLSPGEPEILISDAGIDALGIRIESFAPGRWRFADDVVIRDTESPQYW